MNTGSAVQIALPARSGFFSEGGEAIKLHMAGFIASPPSLKISLTIPTTGMSIARMLKIAQALESDRR